MTLQDVHIETEGSWNNTGSAPIEIKGNGDTNLELNGDNTVLSGDSKHAGIEKADVNGHGTLTIKDDLNNDRSVKDKDENGNAVGRDTGKLVAGGNYNGAAIGGGGTYDTACTSNITITGGDITAPVSAPVAMEMHQISALRAMHMLPPFQTAVLPLDPVIMRQATVILPSPIMPLWRLLA